MRLAPSGFYGAREIAALLSVVGLGVGCGSEPQPSEPTEVQSFDALSCGAGCGGPLGSAILPGPTGSVTLTAWSNSPELGTTNDCDPTACAGNSPVTARNGHLTYGCPWQCVELVNRYFQGTWGDPKIAADAGAGFCQRAASTSLPQYYVYGAYGVSTSGHAPIAGDVLVWSSHVAIATNSMSAGAAGAISVIQENATCSGTDTVSWNGTMFGGKYGLSALCWVHAVANTGSTGPMCPTGSNWNLAGDYCGDAPGMQNTASTTLYSCQAAGGAASVKQVCSQGCLHMPAGQNDRCASPLPNGASCAAGSQCQSGDCVSGICCNSACGPCGSCATGTCTPLAAHSSGHPGCANGLLCSGGSTSCPVGCTTSADCASGDSCSGSACVPQDPDAGTGIDGGDDAGTPTDADAGTATGADAGTPTVAIDEPTPAVSATGCASGGGGIAWSTGPALAVWLAISRRRRHARAFRLSAGSPRLNVPGGVRY